MSTPTPIPAAREGLSPGESLREQERVKLSRDGEEFFDSIREMESLRIRLAKTGAAGDRRRYATEWSLKSHAVAYINQNIDDRQESMVCRIADAQGWTFENANKYVIENL